MAKETREASFGLFTTFSDLLLFYLSFGEGPEVLEGLSKAKIKRATRHLEDRGFTVNGVVTSNGFSRIVKKLPRLEVLKTWERDLYLVTYDIPAKQNYKRNVLRGFLKKLGARPVMDSSWLTLSDPRELLNEFLRFKGIEGTVLVSTLARDGAFGEEDIKSVIARAFFLEEVSEKYTLFIQGCIQGRGSPQLALLYYSTLKEDPQLPLELLPANWPATRASEWLKRIAPLIQDSSSLIFQNLP